MVALSKTRLAVMLLIGATASLHAQVLSPMEISDEKVRQLQGQHLKSLMAIGSAIRAHKFAYPFYFSRVLDIDLSQMQRADQRSIRFDKYKNQTVLEITGNYYAAYSAERMDASARLMETFEQVIMPMLDAEVEQFPDQSNFSSFAIEVSHHVRQEIDGVHTERPENVTVIVPVAVAWKLARANIDDQKQAAMLDAQFFLNGEPYVLWASEGEKAERWKKKDSRPFAADKVPVEVASAAPTTGSPIDSDAASTSGKTPATPESLHALQQQFQNATDRIVKALDQQMHFVSYAPPTFVEFRQAAYLQISVRTSLEAAPGTSQYKLAALAFDDHVSHLIRPLLEYFPENADFDGVSFASMVQISDGSRSEAVEFFFPLSMMRRFANYDCTGQQLMDSGIVLINGERSALDLQGAEGHN